MSDELRGHHPEMIVGTFDDKDVVIKYLNAEVGWLKGELERIATNVHIPECAFRPEDCNCARWIAKQALEGTKRP